MRIILYSGKGGVGKTTLSAATAVRAAELGHRTLVMSTDAAHSLADALEREVAGSPTPIAPGLDALEVDVNAELAEHWGVIHAFLTRFMTVQGVRDAVAEELAIFPGMEELFSLMKVKAFAEAGRYDLVVIDCAPTGETVRMLSVPEVLEFYFTRIFPIQRTVAMGVRPVARRMTDIPIPDDDVFGAIKGLHRHMEGLGALLQNPATSSIRLVLNPERMVIKESQRLYTYLNLFGFPVDCVVANRVLPQEARSPYFESWFEIQARYLEEARQAFEPLPCREARLFDREMTGVEELGRLGLDVFGADDPATVFHRERPVEVAREAGGYALYIRLPFAEKEQIQVYAHGEELVVQVQNQRRNIALPRTLVGRPLLGAGYRDRRLRVAFGERK